MTDNNVDQRLNSLEIKLDETNDRIDGMYLKFDELTDTLAQAMELFSQATKLDHEDFDRKFSEFMTLTERRFQSTGTREAGVQSRYRRSEYAIAGAMVKCCP